MLLLPRLTLVIIVAATVLLITRRFELLGLTAVPLLGFFAFRHLPSTDLRLGALAVLASVTAISAVTAVRKRLFVRTEQLREQVKLWRFLVRPAAMAFPTLLFLWERTGTIILLGAVTAVFLAMDLTRLTAASVNQFLFRRAASTFKTREQDRLSTMTLFLVASLLVMLIFNRVVTLYAMAFMVFGDFAAKFFGLWFGRVRLLAKTLEGTLGHLVTCLSVGAIIAEFVPIPLPAIAITAIVATAAEVLPWDLDDNLTVGVFSATALHFCLRLFP
ncbi:MAG: hypothetical protein ABIL25_09380 [candidate division WOR-3 bacterium]